MSRASTITNAKVLYTDAHTLKTHVADALDHIDTSLGGWPPDSTNATGGGGGEEGSRTERTAFKADKARADLDAMVRAVKAATPHLQTAAAIARRWSMFRTDGRSVVDQLAAIEADIWCANHLRHGEHEPRWEQHKLCQFCYEFQAKYKRSVPVEVFNLKRTKSHIFESDVKRILARNVERTEEAKANDAARKRRERARTKGAA